jgi:hypothetical protein
VGADGTAQRWDGATGQLPETYREGSLFPASPTVFTGYAQAFKARDRIPEARSARSFTLTPDQKRILE